MRIRPQDGSIEVAAGSRVLIASTAVNMGQNQTAYPHNAACTSGQSAVVVADVGLTRTGTFSTSNVVGQTCAIELAFDFIPDANGEFSGDPKYTVKLTEQRPDGTQDTLDNPPPVVPPPLARRGYIFVTV